MKVTVYPFGQAVTTTHTDLDAVCDHIKGFLSLHQPGARVDIELEVTA